MLTAALFHHCDTQSNSKSCTWNTRKGKKWLDWIGAQLKARNGSIWWKIYIEFASWYTMSWRCIHVCTTFNQEGHDGPGSLTWENMKQMLNKTNCIAKICLVNYCFTLQVVLEMTFSFLFSLIGKRTWSLMRFALKMQKIWPQLWFPKSIKEIIR